MDDSLDAASFGQALFDEISRRGLGNIPKREMDILLLHLLELHGGFASLTNGELSVRLRTTEAKIRGLRHEASLRFSEDLRDEYRRRLSTVLARATLHLKKDRVVFVVEDRFVRSMLLTDLKAQGSYADWSFNSELLQVDPDALVEVLVSQISESELTDVKGTLGVGTTAAVRSKVRDALQQGLAKVKAKATDEVVDIGSDWIKDAMEALPGKAAKLLFFLAI